MAVCEAAAREEESVSNAHRALLSLATVVLALSAIAVAFNWIDAVAGVSAAGQVYRNGWSVATMVVTLTGNAIYLPGVLLGLAALILAQSKTTRGRAARMTRTLLVLGGIVVMLGIGRAFCEAASDYYSQQETLAWPTAQTGLGVLGRALFHAGVLAGLAYLSRQRPEPRSVDEATSSERPTS